ncbi:hypothetical protein [Burkholderia dolosa]
MQRASSGKRRIAVVFQLHFSSWLSLLKLSSDRRDWAV